MNVALLIDAIVRQTSVLVAQLAVSGGRPSLAHTANQVFVDLVHELKEQGVGNKVIADMFGMALRTYHDRLRRLEQESRYAGCSLWEAVAKYIEERSPVSQAELLLRFRNEDLLTLKGVLRDLVDNGRVERQGRGGAVVLIAVGAQPQSAGKEADVRIANLVWIAINRFGPCTFGDLSTFVPSHEAALHRAVQRLIAEKKVQLRADEYGERYVSDGCVIDNEDPFGWEAAVFDHYQAMVQALCTRLRADSDSDAANRGSGGSTYTYLIADEHPMRDEVFGFLSTVRKQAESLRRRVAEYNAVHPEVLNEPTRVTTYIGQCAD